MRPFGIVPTILQPQEGEAILVDGRRAEFLHFGEKLVGPLDTKGRAPGRYVDHTLTWFRYPGSTLRYTRTMACVLLHVSQPVDLSERLVVPADFDFESQRIGDLPYPLTLYPDDVVVVTATGGGMSGERIRSLELMSESFNCVLAGGACYHASALQLRSRGNVWALYNDPSKLSFESDAAEAKFWSRNGIGTIEVNPDLVDNPKRECMGKFSRATADLIYYNEESTPWHGWTAFALHTCWAHYRERVRSLSMRLVSVPKILA